MDRGLTPPTDEIALPPVLRALDEAVRGIGGVLELDRVLQLIVDHVRTLVQAEYAALGARRRSPSRPSARPE